MFAASAALRGGGGVFHVLREFPRATSDVEDFAVCIEDDAADGGDAEECEDLVGVQRGAVDEFAAPQRIVGVDAEVVAEWLSVGADGCDAGVGGGFAAHGFFEDVEADDDVDEWCADGAVGAEG
ncbi:MAG: hypothetical protein ACE367_25975 [Acidimicrobiales bacterium]